MNVDMKAVLMLHPPVFTREAGGGYSVEVPDFPGCFSEGDTLEEARAMIEDAAEGWIAAMNECGFTIAAAPELNGPRRMELVN